MTIKRIDNVGIVVESLDAVIPFAKLVGEVVQYQDTYRLCYIRGPEGLLIGLAEELKSGHPA